MGDARVLWGICYGLVGDAMVLWDMLGSCGRC